MEQESGVLVAEFGISRMRGVARTQKLRRRFFDLDSSIWARTLLS